MIKWTEDQQKIFDLKNHMYGKFVVNACPGSGKTKCVSQRIIQFINEHKFNSSGLLILSFTNVAIDEINKNYKAVTNKEIKYPHYIGTFDKFINEFIFLPFGYLLLNSKKRPKLVGSPHSKWFSLNYKSENLDKVSYDINGKLIALKNKIKLDKELLKNKSKFNNEGYANQNDANYFSMKILEECPNIAKAIVIKFPYLIVDEAQDLTDIQMKIINILENNGLENILLVGDPNQAIFEWNNANPLLFMEKYKKWNNINLNCTFRCCNVISDKLSLLTENKIISNINKGNNFKLLSYDLDCSKIAEEFLKIINNENNKEDTAILFRRNIDKDSLFKRNNQFSINDIFKDMKNDSDYKKSNKDFKPKQIKSYTKDIISAECHLLNNNFLNGFKDFERAYIKLTKNKFNNITNEINIINKNNFYQHRKNVLNFINQFNKPLKNQLIENWICDINENELYIDKKRIFLNKIKTKYKNIKINEQLRWEDIIYNNLNNNFYYGTIHSAKGKTFKNVLLILNHNCIKNLGKKCLMEDEELRIMYVGMSRAKYRLWIAIPNKDLNTCKKFFEQNKLLF